MEKLFQLEATETCWLSDGTHSQILAYKMRNRQRKGTAQRNPKPPQQTIRRRRGESLCNRGVSARESALDGSFVCSQKKLPRRHRHQLSCAHRGGHTTQCRKRITENFQLSAIVKFKGTPNSRDTALVSKDFTHDASAAEQELPEVDVK